MASSIFELMSKIPAIIHVTGLCERKLPVIHTFKDTRFDMQKVFYWWRDANNYLNTVTQDQQTLVEGQANLGTIVPSMLGIPEQLDFIDRELNNLARETEMFLEDRVLPPKVQYKLEQGYNKVMEAIYSNEMSKTFYEEYQRHTR